MSNPQSNLKSNSRSKSNLSKHRHISFTAHYTGYIWFQMGISHPALATAKGKSLAMIANPVETLAEKYIGGSMRTTLKTRHTLLDEHLTQLIKNYKYFYWQSSIYSYLTN